MRGKLGVKWKKLWGKFSNIWEEVGLVLTSDISLFNQNIQETTMLFVISQYL